MRSIAAVVCFACLALCRAADVGPEMRRVRADLEFLCSDVLAGRASLTPAADTAARYIAADFARTGLKAPFLQSFPMVAYKSNPQQRSLVMKRGGTSKAFKEFTGAFSRTTSEAEIWVSSSFWIRGSKSR